jgi:MoaA/NifB/PqqE/SkfB family radical SAM enzyme
MTQIPTYDPDWTGQPLVPRRVVIETIFGCNATCGMCVINHETERQKGYMPMERFVTLANALAPFRDSIDMFDLFGLGEPLIDPHLADRIRLVKQLGFRNTAISTNAHLLDEKKQKALLEAGLDTVIFSIDGFSAETHEAVRERTNYQRVVDNALSMIRMRDQGGYKTRFVVRFVRQERNAHEWDAYREFWLGQVSRDKRDIVMAFDVHNWSGQVVGEVSGHDAADSDDPFDALPCHHIFEKLVILADGSVSLCFEDILDAQFKFGNVFEQDPIEIFNSPRFNKIRNLHAAGKRCNLGICSKCMVLVNETKRIIA